MANYQKIIKFFVKNKCISEGNIILLSEDIYSEYLLLNKKMQDYVLNLTYKRCFDIEMDKLENMKSFIKFDELAPPDELKSEKFKNFLLFQDIDPVKFKNDFFEWILMTNTRKNTFFIYGPIKTGKTLFNSFIKEMFKCVSNLNSGSQKSEFYFSSLNNSVLCFINEPFFNLHRLEDVKSLACGEEIGSNKKFTTIDQPIRRIPLMITTNFKELCRGNAPPISEKSIWDKSFVYCFKKQFSYEDNLNLQDFLYFLFN